MKFGIAVTNAVSPAVTPAGQADYVSRVAKATEEAGLDHAIVSVATDDTDATVDQVRRFAEDVVARV